MNRTLKSILLFVGIVLLVFGVYRLFMPETAVSIGSLDIATQDDTNAYISIGIGLAVLLVSLLVGKSTNK